MSLNDMLAVTDPARLPLLWQTCVDIYNQVLPWLTYAWPALVLTFLLAFVFYLSRHPLNISGQWVTKRRGKRAMRIEDDQLRHYDLMEDIACLIEDKVDKGIWDRQDADVEYAKLKKRFPEFSRCISDPENIRKYFKELGEERMMVIRLQAQGGAAPEPIFIKTNR